MPKANGLDQHPDTIPLDSVTTIASIYHAPKGCNRSGDISYIVTLYIHNTYGVRALLIHKDIYM